MVERGRVLGLPALLLVLLLLAACSPIASPTEETHKAERSLTLYSGRSEALVAPIIQQFGEATGIRVGVKYASTPELAATLQEEGERSPADVFWAQEPGGLGAVEGMLSSLPEGILSRVPAWARSSQGRWVGLTGRARTVVYNTQTLAEADLPDDIWGFTESGWKGRIGWAPGNASFQTMVTGMRTLWGEERTRQWLAGILANEPRVFDRNAAIVAAVGAGEIDAGFVNHYYLLRALAENGESFPARNYHPRGGGPGALMMVAGAGILSTSKNREAGERFLEFLLSPVAQQYFAGQTFEYPLVDGVQTPRELVPWKQVRAPDVTMTDLADLKGTQRILRETGVL